MGYPGYVFWTYMNGSLLLDNDTHSEWHALKHGFVFDKGLSIGMMEQVCLSPYKGSEIECATRSIVSLRRTGV